MGSDAGAAGSFDDVQFSSVAEDVPVNVGVDELKAPGGIVEPDSRREQYRLGLLEQDLEERKHDVRDRNQAHDMRKHFYRLAVALLSGAIIASVGVLGAYMWSQWGEVEATVMVGFFGSVAAEVIGLAAIVARYLFGGHRRAAADTEAA